MGSRITTTYQLDNQGRVASVEMKNDGGESCCAVLDATSSEGLYNYYSFLEGDNDETQSPKQLSLADCILAAYVHLGLIPPQNFDPIKCNNHH
jgi:hypothetical protein